MVDIEKMPSKFVAWGVDDQTGHTRGFPRRAALQVVSGRYGGVDVASRW